LAKTSLTQLAYYLVLIGGILMIVLSLISMLGLAIRVPSGLGLPGLTFGFGALLTLILGIIAVWGARNVGDLVWAIVLIVVGYIGGGLGGVLVLIGGIIGLLSRLVR